MASHVAEFPSSPSGRLRRDILAAQPAAVSPALAPDPSSPQNYVSIPPLREMVKFLTSERGTRDKTAKISKGLGIALWIAIFCFCLFFCLSFVVKPLPRPLAILGVASLAVCVVMILFIPFFDAIRNREMYMHPSRYLAGQLDEHLQREMALADRLKSIPRAALLEQHVRIESQSNALEKWIDIARVIWLLGPVVVLLFQSGFQVSDGTSKDIQMIAAALSVGVLIGALQMRAGMLGLHRLACTFKIAIERSKAPLAPRKVSRKRKPAAAH